MSLRCETPCDFGECPYDAMYGRDCDYWCGDYEPEDYPEEDYGYEEHMTFTETQSQPGKDDNTPPGFEEE